MAFSVLRLKKIICLAMLSFILIGGRLFFLQALEADKLSRSALESRIAEAPADGVRGDILDRNGLPLTGTARQTYLFFFPAQIEHTDRVFNLLAEYGVDSQELKRSLQANLRPFKWKQPVGMETGRRINEANMPGVVAVTDKKRYSLEGVAAHVVGYINAADNQGVSGLEAAYDSVLRGLDTTYVAAMVDAGQQLIPGLGYKRISELSSRRPGNLVLTLDKRIQHIVEEVLDSSVSKGAVIVMNPANGEILAMVSRPNFDADRLTMYLNQQSAPLVNRSIMNYQPGSVFKLAIAAAALENNLVKPDDMFFDNGYIDVNHIRFRGWDFDKQQRGRISFTEALAYSSNPVFIEVGLKTGAHTVIDCARKLGFGRASGIGLKGEAAGNLPEPDSVFAADLANLSIGQGTLEATPLQVAGMVSAIANGGILRQPVLVSRVINEDGSVTVIPPGRVPERVLSETTAKQIRAMMAAVTAFGTGMAAQVTAGAAGKTGSAETGRLSDGKSINHAWFVGFAPLVKPEFVMVVFVEEGMSGGDIAAPLFREIMERILTERR